MNDQRQLWTGDDIQVSSARRTDPETSHLAALDATPTAPTLRALALQELVRNGDGLTDFELADRLTVELTAQRIARDLPPPRPVQQTSAGKRRGELRDDGLVEDAGIRRPAPSGSASIVWRATQKGRDVYLANAAQLAGYPGAQNVEPA